MPTPGWNSLGVWTARPASKCGRTTSHSWQRKFSYWLAKPRLQHNKSIAKIKRRIQYNHLRKEKEGGALLPDPTSAQCFWTKLINYPHPLFSNVMVFSTIVQQIGRARKVYAPCCTFLALFWKKNVFFNRGIFFWNCVHLCCTFLARLIFCEIVAKKQTVHLSAPFRR